MMGFEGTEVTPQIRTLIEDHHLGAILLSTKNMKCNNLYFLFPFVVFLLFCRFVIQWVLGSGFHLSP